MFWPQRWFKYGGESITSTLVHSTSSLVFPSPGEEAVNQKFSNVGEQGTSKDQNIAYWKYLVMNPA